VFIKKKTSINLSISIYLSVYLSISIYLSVYISISIYISVYLSISLPRLGGQHPLPHTSASTRWRLKKNICQQVGALRDHATSTRFEAACLYYTYTVSVAHFGGSISIYIFLLARLGVGGFIQVALEL
jgi:hypothetical protein